MKQQLLWPAKNHSLGSCHRPNRFQGSNLPNRPILIKQSGAHSPFQEDDQHFTQFNTKTISCFNHEIDAKDQINYIGLHQLRHIPLAFMPLPLRQNEWSGRNPNRPTIADSKRWQPHMTMNRYLNSRRSSKFCQDLACSKLSPSIMSRKFVSKGAGASPGSNLRLQSS